MESESSGRLEINLQPSDIQSKSRNTESLKKMTTKYEEDIPSERRSLRANEMSQKKMMRKQEDQELENLRAQ